MSEEDAKKSIEQLSTIRSDIMSMIRRYNNISIESQALSRIALIEAEIDEDRFELDENKKPILPEDPFDNDIDPYYSIEDCDSNIYWRSSSLNC